MSEERRLPAASHADKHSSRMRQTGLPWPVPGDYNEAMTYKVALYKSEEGYAVSVPGLPGCWSQGATEQDALNNIHDAIEEYLAVAEELLHQQQAEIREVKVGA